MSFFRAIKIARIAARYRLDTLFPHYRWFFLLTFLAYINPRCWFVGRRYSRGVRLRLALETLGPIFVKFGQILSTRRDLLADDIAVELAKLQDQVPPFPSDQAIMMVEQTYDRSINKVFKEFSPTPLASASIAQVHAAILPNGADVVVKILRPKVKQHIRRDIKFLYSAARWLCWLWEDGKRLRPMEVVAEFEKTIFDELDMLREAANAALLRRNFPDSAMIYIPKVYFDYTTKNILVLERIYGTRISEIDKLKEQRVDMHKLARYGVEIFMTQVFRDRFFHADMHPGNIFVNIKDPKNPSYCAIDFGIMGTLSPQDQHYLAENFLAFFQQDYRRIAELHLESAWVPNQTNVEDFTAAIRTVCEPIFQKPISEISFGRLLLNLFQTARRFNMEIQPQLILLQKTLLNVEGLGRELYPQLNLWDTVQPFLQQWMRDRYSVKTIFTKIKENLPFWIEKLPEMPTTVYQYLQTENQQVDKIQQLERRLHNIEKERKWWLTGQIISVLAILSLVILFI